MNDDARVELADIVRTEGRGISADTRRLQVLLSDRCGTYQLEINLLVSAADDGVPDALLRGTDGLPTEATAEQLARQLEEGRGIEYGRSRWAVDSWALALGVDPRNAPTAVAATIPTMAGPSAHPPPDDGSLPPPPLDYGAPPSGPPGPKPNSKWVLISGGVVIGAIAIIVVLVLVLSVGKGKGKPSVASTAVPSPTTTPRTTVTPTTQPTSAEALLIARVPTSYRSTCKTLIEQDKRTDFQNIPAITCDPNGTVSVFFYQLPNATVMNDEYHSLVSANNLPDTTCDPNRNSNFRAASTYTTGSTERGKALCYVGTDSTARMEWTDDALNTYGSIAADDSAANRQTIYQFWVDNGALTR